MLYAYEILYLIFKIGHYNHIKDVVRSTENCGYFYQNTPGECTYRMIEYNPDDQQWSYSLFMDQIITASAG